MTNYDRRAFLGSVGSGMLASAVGLTVINELGLHGLVFAQVNDRIDFGKLESLVSMLQETSADPLMSKLKAELDRGTELRTLITAAALANARTFGGQDYTGYRPKRKKRRRQSQETKCVFSFCQCVFPTASIHRFLLPCEPQKSRQALGR